MVPNNRDFQEFINRYAEDTVSTKVRSIMWECWDAAIEAAKKVCNWRYDDLDGKWDTDCGEAWVFEIDGPNHNGMRYCCYCGRTLVEGK